MLVFLAWLWMVPMLLRFVGADHIVDDLVHVRRHGHHTLGHFRQPWHAVMDQLKPMIRGPKRLPSAGAPAM